MQGPFFSCQAKMNRAKEHLATLARAQADYFDGGELGRPFTVDGHFDASTGVYSFVGNVTRDPPDRIGTIVGDVIHNLRSALDHAVWELIRMNGDDPDSFVKERPAFPILNQESKWSAERSRLLKRVSDSAAFRIRQLQPFETHGSSADTAPLSRLHSLWNQDKHRIVMPLAASVETYANAGVGFVRSRAAPEDAQVIPVRDVAAVHKVEAIWGVPIHHHPVAEAHITASGPSPLLELRAKAPGGLWLADDGPVNYALATMARAVDGALLALAQELP